MFACADIPALPLQLLLLEHKDWQQDPVVVVEEDKPLASILWVNRAARELKIHRGLRFAQARALTARLRAAVMPKARVEEAVESIFAELLTFTPRVEPSRAWPGLFWLDPNGLQGLFGSLEVWVAEVHQRLTSLGFVASVLVGHSRYAVFAIARTTTGAHVILDRHREAERAKYVPLTRLHVSTKLCRDMAVLGVHTLGDFMALPGHELRLRYGEEAEALHRLATGKAWTPFLPAELKEPLRAELQVEPPDDNQTRLLFGLKSKVHEILRQLEARSEALLALRLTLCMEGNKEQSERIETAGPTLDVVQVTDLLRLRLAAIKIAAPVKEMVLVAQSVLVHPQQLGFLQGKRRDLEAAARALARVKATFGRAAVTRAVIQDTVLPEAKFRWQPHSELCYPELTLSELSLRPLMRQLYATPIRLPAIPKHEPERWLGTHGAVEQMFGPYRVSGGWWMRRVMRDYYFVETKTGELLWLFYDSCRRRWMLQGVVD